MLQCRVDTGTGSPPRDGWLVSTVRMCLSTSATIDIIYKWWTKENCKFIQTVTVCNFIVHAFIQEVKKKRDCDPTKEGEEWQGSRCT
ncbi:hypothetical protein RJT34_25046 [Clitoria ternatea]|uniref:Uncharacterized protein n=1 Tax=Clitoria ternatea TaxID=43366 RepID=A0AAN9IIK0_CLITE